MPRDLFRLGLIGAGWIMPAHLEALDRLGRTRVVGVASARLASAARLADSRGAAAYDDAERMLDEQRPDAVYIAVPPSAAVAACEAVVARGIPFLVEKPLAATDREGPARVAAAIAERGLVAAVGYHLRALEQLPDVRERLAAEHRRRALEGVDLALHLQQRRSMALRRRGRLPGIDPHQGGQQVLEGAQALGRLHGEDLGQLGILGARPDAAQGIDQRRVGGQRRVGLGPPGGLGLPIGVGVGEPASGRRIADRGRVGHNVGRDGGRLGGQVGGLGFYRLAG